MGNSRRVVRKRLFDSCPEPCIVPSLRFAKLLLPFGKLVVQQSRNKRLPFLIRQLTGGCDYFGYGHRHGKIVAQISRRRDASSLRIVDLGALQFVAKAGTRTYQPNGQPRRSIAYHSWQMENQIRLFQYPGRRLEWATATI